MRAKAADTQERGEKRKAQTGFRLRGRISEERRDRGAQEQLGKLRTSGWALTTSRTSLTSTTATTSHDDVKASPMATTHPVISPHPAPISSPTQELPTLHHSPAGLCQAGDRVTGSSQGTCPCALGFQPYLSHRHPRFSHATHAASLPCDATKGRMLHRA